MVSLGLFGQFRILVSLGFLTRFLTQFLTLTLTLTLTLNPNPNQAHKREKEANKSTAAAGVRLTLNPGKGIADVVGWLSSPPQGAAGGGGGGGAAAGGGDGGGAGGAALGGGAGAPGAWRCDRLLQCEGRAVHTNPEAADGAGNVLAAALTASPGLGGVARRVGSPLSCTNISGPGATATQMQGLAHTKLMLQAALDPKRCEPATTDRVVMPFKLRYHGDPAASRYNKSWSSNL